MFVQDSPMLTPKIRLREGTNLSTLCEVQFTYVAPFISISLYWKMF
uniref:Uncharacterized protein n=1 Tax=Anguilla anguilla TaxID=7936 RepID=A0A0E9V5V3_ANGAN